MMSDLTWDYHRLTSGLVVALFVILLWYYRKITKPYTGIPTFPALFYVVPLYLKGSLTKTIPLTESIFQLLHGVAKLFEKEELFLIWWGTEPFIFVNGGDAAKFFFTNPAAMEKAPKYDVMKNALGTGLVTSHSKIWAYHRKIINPTFHRKVQKSYATVYNTKSRQLVQVLKNETGKPWIDIEEFIKPCTFYILTETVMGVKEDSVLDKASMNNFFYSVTNLVDFTVHRILRPWLHYDFMLPFFSDGRKHRHMYDYTRTFSQQVVKDMLESPEAAIEKSSEVEEDFDFVATKCRPFIRSFVEEHRKNPETFTLDDIRYEITTFMIAGYETTSKAVVSAIYLLGLHPEIQEKAYDEIAARSTDGDLTYEDALELTYLDSIIQETFRLYTPIPMIARHLSKEVNYGKYTIPKGTSVVFFLHSYHRNPEIFPNPEKFDPDRFSPDKMNQYSRYSFTPFGEGPRYCISRKLVIIELKIILAHIIRNFKIISLDPRDKVHHKWNIVLAPVDSTRVRLISRECSS